MEEFLLKYSKLPNGFIKDFYKITEQKSDDNESDIFIDFEIVVKWLETRKDTLKKVLVQKFTKNYDYTIETVKIIKPDGGASKKDLIFITSDCFKTLCMMSQTKNGKIVRTYFLEMEKLVKIYYKEIQTKMKKEFELVKYNQKPKVRKGEKGKVYVFESLNTTETLPKLGKATDLEIRLNSYNTGLANDLKILFELEVDDIDMVENCAKAFLKQFQYRKRKEIYETSVEMISGMLEKCDVFSHSVKEFFEQHKKEFKAGAQRLKKKDGKFFMFIKRDNKKKSKSKSDVKPKRKVTKLNDGDSKGEKPKKVLKKKVTK
jgi:phage anti-repressor protein